MTDEELSRRFDEMESRINARIEQLETKLLTAFHKWASPMDARVRSHTAALRALDFELEQVKDKLDGGAG